MRLLHLTAVGPDVSAASLEFARRLTVVYGASETGKTYVIEALNFMFGARALRQVPEDAGYQRMLLGIEFDDGEVVTVSSDRGRREQHLRVLFREEEVARLQVLVARLLAGVDRRDVDGRLDLRVGDAVTGHDGGVPALEHALDLADGEVAYREAELRVGRIDLPSTRDEVGVNFCGCHDSMQAH